MNRIVTKTSIGKLAVAYEGKRVLEVVLEPQARLSSSRDLFAKKIEKKLRVYFSGDLQEFNPPFLFPAAEESQMRVWLQIREIKYGETCSYSEVSADIKSADIKSHPQKVGKACSANRLLLLGPCHRVIDVDDGLGGWLGSRTDRRRVCHKLWLLKHEQKHYCGRRQHWLIEHEKRYCVATK